ncbi:hypothetical protein LTR56_023319 [Elasticomyces elasticus]|nr:hypothetical protein LTR56_023319 [Elasticomyces elasticus]KAK3629842.1 hypothetical protein LTR22_021735 [Elasticomyces elasticus]KAK4908835.1 hypothetical protein LTR49_022339 [Elasticomyces elasticus]KAK5743910.1 hypothetical protein LTS12_023674 [Elasticomyces elasticus]
MDGFDFDFFNNVTADTKKILREQLEEMYATRDGSSEIHQYTGPLSNTPFEMRRSFAREPRSRPYYGEHQLFPSEDFDDLFSLSDQRSGQYQLSPFVQHGLNDQLQGQHWQSHESAPSDSIQHHAMSQASQNDLSVDSGTNEPVPDQYVLGEDGFLQHNEMFYQDGSNIIFNQMQNPRNLRTHIPSVPSIPSNFGAATVLAVATSDGRISNSNLGQPQMLVGYTPLAPPAPVNAPVAVLAQVNAPSAPTPFVAPGVLFGIPLNLMFVNAKPPHHQNNPVVPTAVTIYTPGPALSTFVNVLGVRRLAGHGVDLEAGVNVPAKEAQMPDCWVSIAELLMAMPLSTIAYSNILLRAKGNGWSTRLMATVMLYARGIVDDDALERRDRCLRHQIIKAGQETYPHHLDWTTRDYPNDVLSVTTYDATVYAPRQFLAARIAPKTLAEIGTEWLNFPPAQDCWFLTMALTYAAQVGNTTWTTANIPSLVQSQGWMLPAEALSPTADQDSRVRMIALLRAAGVTAKLDEASALITDRHAEHLTASSKQHHPKTTSNSLFRRLHGVDGRQRAQKGALAQKSVSSQYLERHGEGERWHGGGMAPHLLCTSLPPREISFNSREEQTSLCSVAC